MPTTVELGVDDAGFVRESRAVWSVADGATTTADTHLPRLRLRRNDRANPDVGRAAPSTWTSPDPPPQRHRRLNAWRAELATGRPAEKSEIGADCVGPDDFRPWVARSHLAVSGEWFVTSATMPRAAFIAQH